MHVEYYISLKCNLNCAGCATFSPLVKEDDFKSLEKIETDFKKFYMLTKDNVQDLTIMGGEPLMHPQINDIIVYFSELFPETKLRMITNGILIPKMNDEFFELIKDRIKGIIVTEYPIALDYSNIFKILDEKQINYDKWGPKYEFGHQYLHEQPEDYKDCWYRDLYILNDNKIYACTEIAFFKIFNKSFKNHNLKISEEDYIDLDKIDSYEELVQAKKKIPPFCSHCDGHDKKLTDWRISKRDRNEWLKS